MKAKLDLREEQRMNERFHQAAATKVVEYTVEHVERLGFAALGRLRRLELSGGAIELPSRGGKQVELACDGKGKQLYCLGGDQSVSGQALRALLGPAADKDFMVLGECKVIVYDTRKGFHEFELVGYWHKFGEETGVKPFLYYDRLSGLLSFAGGEYEVRREGIVN